MMQQWQQMSNQQKALTIGLIAVIVLALAFVIWWLVSSNRPPTPATAPTPSGVATAPQMGAPSPSGVPAGTPPEFVAPELAGIPGAVPTQPTTPTPPAPTGPQPGKLTRPPEPGRGDPFAALPAPQPSRTVLPVVVPAVPPASAGTTYAQEPALTREEPLSRLPMLSLQQVPTVNFGSYLAPTVAARPSPTADASGWRMAGFMMSGQRVSAIVELPTGRTRVVQPGSTVEVNGVTYTVTKVEPDRVTLRSGAGEEIVVPRRSTPPAPVGGSPVPYGPSAPYGGYGGYGGE
ncbi:hypothetical protein HRbin17_02291 [bacterium HR17]|uniref:Uncharacterized protein n=1 Tax=Candidatus Fervidibacter japonicus TaxID=2035412 RepID=A0A2H5XF05_9BACT|nr:hypothetical protein HRbin17_02291 [bacterium HR17]